MRYLQTFNRRLRQMREAGRLSCQDVAEICGVEEAQVIRWEASDAGQRTYPDLAALLDFCIKTDTPLEDLLDLTAPGDGGQLELPGLVFSNSDDLSMALKELEQVIDRVQLSEEEAEMLRRFRKTTAENRRMILQILGT
ncbi:MULTISPECIES: helix-turn-helix domain-containing protein [unclassified Marinobacter]|uniref:helix-turn-helix domain-containing protein n=1 Tax=unclassified Marinobacter TaxID=83889 RepID=UPI0026E3A3DA|nr:MULTISPECIES: helix-turn-helix transcriptional regulator [unclassified Marinobacter]MDO6442554.1 helix-turn-helix transcriptional regulator [Marinobacter sp. 2_MG-2023]MDO6824610.1 helix-turn-helix transcriptional regulator [Marinobacter sp. 1_MG-2023]